MKKVLYVTNIQVPYRVKFFNELSKYCNLTVLYERSSSDNRNIQWSKSENEHYKSLFLNGIHVGRETTFSFNILKYVFSDYDAIIIGCYNSPVQMFTILVMRLFKKEYFLNIDGEIFVGEGIKSKMKRFFLNGASKYFIAGEQSALSLKQIVKSSYTIIPYYFSSLSKDELEEYSKQNKNRENFVLVVGQYFDYKGLDVAVEAAKQMTEVQFLFVGMGYKTEQFSLDFKINDYPNIKVIPFLQKEELNVLYQKARLLILPSRQECWGLVVYEAAAFGTPIVSTYGSGAAEEFLINGYEHFLAEPGNPDDLIRKIKLALEYKDIQLYSNYLREKASQYHIERNVECHLKAI